MFTTLFPYMSNCLNQMFSEISILKFEMRERGGGVIVVGRKLCPAFLAPPALHCTMQCVHILGVYSSLLRGFCGGIDHFWLSNPPTNLGMCQTPFWHCQDFENAFYHIDTNPSLRKFLEKLRMAFDFAHFSGFCRNPKFPYKIKKLLCPF